MLWQQPLHQCDVLLVVLVSQGAVPSKETRNLILPWSPHELEEPTYLCLSACTQWYPNHIIVVLDSPKEEFDMETVR